MKNGTMMQGFEWYLPPDSNHWNRIKEQAKDLSQSGITSIWLPPAYKGAGGANSVGYDVYDLFDLGEFDQKGSVATKYGSREDYLACIKELQKQGVQVYTDIVLNHMMGADGVETVQVTEDAGNNREQTISGQFPISAWTKFDFPGRNGKYSNHTWDWRNFSGTDWDDNSKRNGVFLFEGKQWNRETDSEFVNFDYLMGADMDTDCDDTCNALLDWGKWYYDTLHMDGLRLDAVKHISFDFYRNWLKEMRQYTGKELFTVGEYWSPEVGRLTHYLDAVENSMSLFDVPLHFKFYQAATSNGDFDLGSIKNDTLVTEKPMNAVTFVDNHDTQPGQALVSFIPEWFKPIAYGIILLQKDGYPCVFYGDYYGIEHDGIKPTANLKTLIKLRELYAYGDERDYYDSSDVCGFTRSGDAEHVNSGLAVVFTDRGANSKYMIVDEKYAGQEFYDILHPSKEHVILDEKGGAVFSVDGGSISVYVSNKVFFEINF